MPKPITKYLCNTCNSEHYDIQHAIACENQPAAIDKINQLVGTELTFEEEEVVEGQLAYMTTTAKILHKQVLNSKGVHVWVYIVDVQEEGTSIYERGVVAMMNKQSNALIFVSPYTLAYRPGTAAHMKSQNARSQIIT